MLIDIEEIKEKLGVLSSISSNVSSILSKVNGLGSQKSYKLSFTDSGLAANSYVNLDGAGILVISNINQGSINASIGGKSVMIPRESTIAIPIGSAQQFWHTSTGYNICIAWCPLS